MAKLSPESAWDFADAIKAIVKQPSTRRRATVQSIDKDGTIWVQLPGSDHTTPVRSSGANVSPGDIVTTEINGTSLDITGNYSDPAIGSNQAGHIAKRIMKPVQESVIAAQNVADEAKAVANATNQHFWDDDTGAHVTDVTQDEWHEAEADDFSDASDSKPYHNLLMNSLGILLRTALKNLVSITRSAIAFYDGTGNNASNIVARFGSDGAQIGLSDESHINLDYHSMQLVDAEQRTYMHVSDLRDANGEVWYYKRWAMDGHTTYLSISPAAVNTTYDVFVYDADSQDVTANYTITKSAGFITVAPQPPDGYAVSASYKSSSTDAKVFTFGSRNTSGGGAGGRSSSFGNLNVAQGETAFASGWMSQAHGKASHALGSGCKAMRDGSVAFGNSTKSSGVAAQAQNFQTIAASANQTAMGKYNVADYQGDYALIIGNGTADDARSNALAVTWDGDIECANDTAWTTLNGVIKYRIHHGVCYVVGDSASGGTSVGTGGTNVGTLPTGACPSVTIYGSASTKSDHDGQFSIDANGVIKVWNLYTSSVYWCFSTSYPV